jgi:hypothetical protein
MVNILNQQIFARRACLSEELGLGLTLFLSPERKLDRAAGSDHLLRLANGKPLILGAE